MSQSTEKATFMLAACVVICAICASSAAPRRTTVGPGPTWLVNYDESKGPPYKLEDPLTFVDGTKLQSPADWPRRRAEILDLFAREMYGQPPPPPEAVVAETREEGVTLGGYAIRRQVRIWFRKDRSGPHLDWLILFPRHLKGPFPVLLGLNYKGNHSLMGDPEIPVPDDTWVHVRKTGYKPVESDRAFRCNPNGGSIFPAGMLIARGYAVMTACYGQVSPDPIFSDPDPANRPLARAFQGVFSLWGPRDESRTDDISSFGAWAWSLSRGLDLAGQVKELDATRCLVTGFSRLAKAALLAAARDERFAACVPVQCGAGGVQLLKRDFGETVGIVNTAFPHWVCRAYAKYSDNEDEMPFDQHLLLATLAPRPVLVLGFDDPWYDTKGEYLSCRAASPVWEFLGKPGFPNAPFPPPYDLSCVGDVIGYIHRTVEHGMAACDWTWIMDFADRVLTRDCGK